MPTVIMIKILIYALLLGCGMIAQMILQYGELRFTIVSDTTDTTSARIVYKCVESPDPTWVIESSIESSLNAYPNPTNSKLNFRSKISGRLFDLLGNEVSRFNQQSEIDISHLTNGVYFLQTDETVIKSIKK